MSSPTVTCWKSYARWPVADRVQRLARLADARLYLCLGMSGSTATLQAIVEQALAGGVRAVQLREKGLEAQAELAALDIVSNACRGSGALLAVNDRADLAVVAGADLLHLGQGDLPPHLARAIVGPDVLIGVSTHTAVQAAAAAIDPEIDYFCAGPVWATPTKPGRAAVGLDQIRAAAAVAGPKPWFAIGGISAQNVAEVIEAGARRIVVVRAVTEAADPQRAASELLLRLHQAVACD